MSIIKMFLSSAEGFGSFYTSTFTKTILVFGVGDGRLTKKTASSRDAITVWLNEVEDLFDDELPAEAYLVEDIGLFSTQAEAQQAIDQLK